MSNSKDSWGCVAVIILVVCVVLGGFMALTFLGKEISSFMKDNPGGFFALLVLVGLVAFIYLREEITK